MTGIEIISPPLVGGFFMSCPVRGRLPGPCGCMLSLAEMQQRQRANIRAAVTITVEFFDAAKIEKGIMLSGKATTLPAAPTRLFESKVGRQSSW
jgi:hypothetical protein